MENIEKFTVAGREKIEKEIADLEKRKKENQVKKLKRINELKFRKQHLQFG